MCDSCNQGRGNISGDIRTSASSTDVRCFLTDAPTKAKRTDQHGTERATADGPVTIKRTCQEGMNQSVAGDTTDRSQTKRPKR